MRSFREQRQDDQKTSAETVETLAGMSQEELQRTLIAEAAKAKAEGTLNQETLQTFYNQIAPMLTEEQREKMRSIMSMLL